MENEQLTDIKQLEGAIEAILFAAGHPMEYSKLGEVTGLTPRDTKQLVAHLAERWNSDDTRGVMLLTFESSCQLCTNEKYLPYIREALGIKRGGNLSASSLEVLAIAAYNQPADLTLPEDRCFTERQKNSYAYSGFLPFRSCPKLLRCLPLLTHWQAKTKTRTARQTQTQNNR